MWENIGSLLWALLVTCVVLVLAYWFTRRVAGRLPGGQGPRSRGGMRIVDQIPLGRDQRLVLVRVGDTLCLLGVTAGSITCLRELSEEESAFWTAWETEKPAAAPQKNFLEALRQTMEQRKR